MSPHLHITIVGLSLLALNAIFIIWSIRRLAELRSHITIVEDFVKFKAHLELAKNSPSKMMDLYTDYIDVEA
tara:strand:+ start:126 stop:341 length:216 start_codon:yes stop_codon:yes gene_type:complete